MFQIRTMITYCLVTLLLLSTAMAGDDLELKAYEAEGEDSPRLFFANFTSSLIQASIL